MDANVVDTANQAQDAHEKVRDEDGVQVEEPRGGEHSQGEGGEDGE